ncbi:O-linked N-acetylglucosamine transferase, SPINDLY family protein [Variovorax fucosicus]|uniref:O-linked N-acetylglucosamine transferase, SPINDLY family protein n=1 Tax=Variovorax fucosicus TaxID=3053517 RepID=UPI002575A161|nr:tetratricopeptide repeat protein [Variovorax sp. J22G47]MDM0054917.1 tetratricopeptide repeat protein [Variovorax sp. J22G47]
MLDSLKRFLRIGQRDARDNLRPRHSTEKSVDVADDEMVYLKQGNSAIKKENYPEAIYCYRRAISIQADSRAGHIGLGFALLQIRDFTAAIISLKKAVALNPMSSDGYYMLGKAYAETRQADAAEEAWRRAHSLSPDLEYIYCDFCLLLFNKGKIPEATTLMEKGISLYPENADFYFYLGNLLSESGNHSAAADMYKTAVALNPQSPYLLSSYANSLRQIGDLDRSIEMLKSALTRAPEAASIFSNYLLSMQYSSNFSKKEKFDAHRGFAQQFEMPLRNHRQRHTNKIALDRKLKIGYVSGDFRNHSLIFFIEPIIKNHNRAEFDVYCYYSYPFPDAASYRIMKVTDHWIGCAGMSDDDLAARIHADEIDVLIDLSGHTGYNRLLVFARKPAPIQMTWLGYQATTGLSAIDFRITDESLDPSGTSEDFHSEKLLRLPSSGTFSPSPDSPPVNPLPSAEGSPFTFGCLNNPSKITVEVVALWAKILKRNPFARLMIGSATPDLENELSAQFLSHGIERHRMVFQRKVSLKEYLALHHQIDLALDTFPYNGGTTTFHSLWMGVPIIALDGNTSLSKVGSSIMRGLGLGNFCSETHEDYVERAVHFSTHLDELSLVRTSLREKMGPVMDLLATEVTSSLERALQVCWAEYCAKESAAKNESSVQTS